jgi:putative FmdB family regulatory protein
MRYEYKCKNCDQTVEIVAPLGSKLEHKCPHCNSKNLKRIWNVPFVKYKGDGFYSSDKDIQEK